MVSIQQRTVEEKTIRNVDEQTIAKPKPNKEEKRQTTRNEESRDRDSLEIDSATKASERILQIEKLTNKSALKTLSAIPPPAYPLTNQEKQILRQLDTTIFKITTPIKIDMLDRLTCEHLNRAYVNYILTGLRNGFRYGYKGIRRRIIQKNLASIEQDVKAFEKSIEKEILKGRYAGPFDPRNPPCQTY